MNIVEKPVEGLSRSYGVMVSASELGEALEARIEEILPTLNLKGFRPGKVPKAHVRRLYGKALMGEVVEKTINDTSQKVLADNGLRIAASPDLKPVSDMARVLDGSADLAYDLEVEVMPDFEPVDVTTLSLTRLVYKPSAAEMDEALAELAAQNRTYEARSGKSPKAKDGDQILIDFLGRIDGEAFEGGAAEDAELILGAAQFIPGFEEQLIGAAPGSEVTVNVTFPADYGAAHLAGKAAAFAVKVKEVRSPQEGKVDDELAKRLGMADLNALTEALRANIEQEFAQASRFKLKRALLDALDARHDIPLPPRMVDSEFAGIWTQVEKDRAEGQESPEDEGKSEEDLRGEYRKIAERRVRLGLVLAENGRRENISVSEAELGDAMREQAMRYGDQAREIFDFMRQNAQYRAQIQAPLYEEKVVDFILSRAQVSEREVDKQTLLQDDDLPESVTGEVAEKPAKRAPAKTKGKASADPVETSVATEDSPAKPKRTAKSKAAPAS